jgi:hypothetical protein
MGSLSRSSRSGAQRLHRRALVRETFALRHLLGAYSHLTEVTKQFRQDQRRSVGLLLFSPFSQCASTSIQNGNVFDENALFIERLASEAL